MNAAMPPWLLRLGDDVEADRGLARALGPEHLDHAPARDPADAQRDVERERARRDHRDAGAHRVLAELHHRALAELLLDLRERDVEHLVPVVHPRSLLLCSLAHPATASVSSSSREGRTLPRGSDMDYTPVVRTVQPRRRYSNRCSRSSRSPESPTIGGITASGKIPIGSYTGAGRRRWLRNSTIRSISNGSLSNATSSGSSPTGGSNRATVRCGVNARFSGANSRASASSRSAARRSSRPAASSSPAHRTRARRAFGNAPSPSTPSLERRVPRRDLATVLVTHSTSRG